MDEEARRLERRLQDWLAEAPAGFVAAGPSRAVRWGLSPAAAAAVEARFEALALELFAFQYERVAVYRAYCHLRGRTPGNVGSSREIPPLPVEAFKRRRIATFAPADELAQFRTSGTTGGDPGVLPLDSLALYDLALARGFEHHVLPDGARPLVLVLVAPVAEAPHSSLSYMLERVMRSWGAPGSRHVFASGAILWHGLRAALEEAIAAGTPVCLLGTTFGWAQVVETWAREGVRLALPPGSRLFETGGTKGRTRELERSELAGAIELHLGIPPSHVVGEYGMTEMGSQLYTTNLRQALRGEPAGGPGWSYPAWVRPRLVRAADGEAVELGAAHGTGLVALQDLANRGSVAHLLTADLGRPLPGATFGLEGRCPRAELRGCGLVHEPGGVTP